MTLHEVLGLPTVGRMHTTGPIFVHRAHTRGAYSVALTPRLRAESR